MILSIRIFLPPAPEQPADRADRRRAVLVTDSVLKQIPASKLSPSSSASCCNLLNETRACRPIYSRFDPTGASKYLDELVPDFPREYPGVVPLELLDLALDLDRGDARLGAADDAGSDASRLLVPVEDL